MRITFIINESGVRTKNVDLPDVESWIKGHGVYADEAKALKAFYYKEKGIPSSFEDGDGDGKWFLTKEDVDTDGETELYDYEFRPIVYRAKNQNGETKDFDDFPSAAWWLSDNAEFSTAENGDDSRYVYPADSETDDNHDCLGEVVEFY